MTIDPKWMSEAFLNEIGTWVEGGGTPDRQDARGLLAHIADLQSALDIEKAYRASDQVEALQTVETLTSEVARLTAESSKWYKSGCDGIDAALEHGVREASNLASQMAELQEHHDTWRTRAQTIEATTVEQIATWLASDSARSVIDDPFESAATAMAVRNGDWKAAQ